jgi:hypothetical protein
MALAREIIARCLPDLKLPEQLIDLSAQALSESSKAAGEVHTEDNSRLRKWIKGGGKITTIDIA